MKRMAALTLCAWMAFACVFSVAEETAPLMVNHDDGVLGLSYLVGADWYEVNAETAASVAEQLFQGDTTTTDGILSNLEAMPMSFFFAAKGACNVGINRYEGAGVTIESLMAAKSLFAENIKSQYEAAL